MTTQGKVTPAQRKTAFLMDRDRSVLDPIGVGASARIGLRVRRAAQDTWERTRSVPQVKLAVRREISAVLPIIAAGMVAGNLAGQWRAYKQAKANSDGSLALGPTAYDGAIKLLRRRLNLTQAQVDDLQKLYHAEALHVLDGASEEIEHKLQTVLTTVTERGYHVKEGVKALGEAFDALGLTPNNSGTLEAIFRTQTQLAYGAGRWALDQAEEVQEILWGYKYVTVGDTRVRVNHAGLDGVTAPKEDPIWKTIWPPNGWNCRCAVIPLFGEEKTHYPPKVFTFEGKTGVPGPDPGFGYNPGMVFNIAGTALEMAAVVWKEELHPRDHGKFAKKEGASGDEDKHKEEHAKIAENVKSIPNHELLIFAAKQDMDAAQTKAMLKESGHSFAESWPDEMLTTVLGNMKDDPNYKDPGFADHVVSHLLGKHAAAPHEAFKDTAPSALMSYLGFMGATPAQAKAIMEQVKPGNHFSKMPAEDLAKQLQAIKDSPHGSTWHETIPLELKKEIVKALKQVPKEADKKEEPKAEEKPAEPPKAEEKPEEKAALFKPEAPEEKPAAKPAKGDMDQHSTTGLIRWGWHNGLNEKQIQAMLEHLGRSASVNTIRGQKHAVFKKGAKAAELSPEQEAYLHAWKGGKLPADEASPAPTGETKAETTPAGPGDAQTTPAGQEPTKPADATEAKPEPAKKPPSFKGVMYGHAVSAMAAAGMSMEQIKEATAKVAEAKGQPGTKLSEEYFQTSFLAGKNNPTKDFGLSNEEKAYLGITAAEEDAKAFDFTKYKATHLMKTMGALGFTGKQASAVLDELGIAHANETVKGFVNKGKNGNKGVRITPEEKAHLLALKKDVGDGEYKGSVAKGTAPKEVDQAGNVVIPENVPKEDEPKPAGGTADGLTITGVVSHLKAMGYNADETAKIVNKLKGKTAGGMSFNAFYSDNVKKFWNDVDADPYQEADGNKEAVKHLEDTAGSAFEPKAEEKPAAEPKAAAEPKDIPGNAESMSMTGIVAHLKGKGYTTDQIMNIIPKVKGSTIGGVPYSQWGDPIHTDTLKEAVESSDSETYPSTFDAAKIKHIEDTAAAYKDVPYVHQPKVKPKPAAEPDEDTGKPAGKIKDDLTAHEVIGHLKANGYTKEQVKAIIPKLQGNAWNGTPFADYGTPAWDNYLDTHYDEWHAPEPLNPAKDTSVSQESLDHLNAVAQAHKAGTPAERETAPINPVADVLGDAEKKNKAAAVSATDAAAPSHQGSALGAIMHLASHGVNVNEIKNIIHGLPGLTSGGKSWANVPDSWIEMKVEQHANKTPEEFANNSLLKVMPQDFKDQLEAAAGVQPKAPTPIDAHGLNGHKLIAALVLNGFTVEEVTHVIQSFTGNEASGNPWKKATPEMVKNSYESVLTSDGKEALKDSDYAEALQYAADVKTHLLKTKAVPAAVVPEEPKAPMKPADVPGSMNGVNSGAAILALKGAGYSFEEALKVLPHLKGTNGTGVTFANMTKDPSVFNSMKHGLKNIYDQYSPANTSYGTLTDADKNHLFGVAAAVHGQEPPAPVSTEAAAVPEAPKPKAPEAPAPAGEAAAMHKQSSNALVAHLVAKGLDLDQVKQVVKAMPGNHNMGKPWASLTDDMIEAKFHHATQGGTVPELPAAAKAYADQVVKQQGHKAKEPPPPPPAPPTGPAMNNVATNGLIKFLQNEGMTPNQVAAAVKGLPGNHKSGNAWKDTPNSYIQSQFDYVKPTPAGSTDKHGMSDFSDEQKAYIKQLAAHYKQHVKPADLDVAAPSYDPNLVDEATPAENAVGPGKLATYEMPKVKQYLGQDPGVDMKGKQQEDAIKAVPSGTLLAWASHAGLDADEVKDLLKMGGHDSILANWSDDDFQEVLDTWKDKYSPKSLPADQQQALHEFTGKGMPATGEEAVKKPKPNKITKDKLKSIEDGNLISWAAHNGLGVDETKAMLKELGKDHTTAHWEDETWNSMMEVSKMAAASSHYGYPNGDQHKLLSKYYGKETSPKGKGKKPKNNLYANNAAMPDDLDEKVEPVHLGGSTGAQLVSVTSATDPTANGKYVKKEYSGNSLQAKNEYLANQFYAALGGDHPNAVAATSKLSTDDSGKTAVYNKFVPGLKELGSLSGAEKEKAMAYARDHFVLDAFLANWDSVGLSMDNMGWDGKKLHRIDNGGALLYRAQGTPKGGMFGKTVGELDSMRKGTNATAKAVFGSLSDEDVAKQIYHLRTTMQANPHLIDQLVESAGFDDSTSKSLKKTLHDRYLNLLDYAHKVNPPQVSGAGNEPVGPNGLVPGTNYVPVQHWKPCPPPPTIKHTLATVQAESKKMGNALDHQERQAVVDFTNSTYGSINKSIVNGHGKHGHVDKLEKALNKMPAYSGWSCRGVGDLDNDLLNKWKSGEYAHARWPAFSSSSIKPGHEFGSSGGAAFIIKSNKHFGRYVGGVSSHSSEYELLYQKDSMFRVVGYAEGEHGGQVAGTKHKLIFVLEEITDPKQIPLSQSPPPKIDGKKLWEEYKAQAQKNGAL